MSRVLLGQAATQVLNSNVEDAIVLSYSVTVASFIVDPPGSVRILLNCWTGHRISVEWRPSLRHIQDFRIERRAHRHMPFRTRSRRHCVLCVRLDDRETGAARQRHHRYF